MMKRESAFGIFLLVATMLSQSASANEYVIVPNAEQVASTQRDPSAQDLMQTLFSGYWFGATSRRDAVHYEVLDKRISWGKQGRAYLHVRFVSPDDHDPVKISKELCKGQTVPIEWQLVFLWDIKDNTWRNTHENGATGSNPCFASPLWTPREVELILSPPIPPAPPGIGLQDITTPPPGSSDREEILDTLRPAFEELVGPPVIFLVRKMKVAAGFAFLTVHGQRPNGEEFESEHCEYDLESTTTDAWVRKVNGKWELAWLGPFCPTDVHDTGRIGYLIGAPPALADRQDWSEDFDLTNPIHPIEEPQYFKLWP